MLMNFNNTLFLCLNEQNVKKCFMIKFDIPHSENLYTFQNTVKTLYNVTRYNRIFNIRHKIVGNGSVSIKIPSLEQNIHLTTPAVTSGNIYTISIEINSL